MKDFNYEKLWRLLDKREMKKEDLRLQIGISSATSARLEKIKQLAWMFWGRYVAC